MRLLPLFLILAGSLIAGEPAPSYPLWDGHETIADYAKKVNLPATKTLDLGNGVKLELVLIPAGRFMMGTPEHENPAVGKTMVGVSGGIMFVVLVVWQIRARRKRKRPQFSMAFMLLMTFVAAVGVWGGVRWNEALKHPDDFSSEHPAHPVTLTQAFYMGKFAVTQEQYQQVIGTNPSNFKGKDNPVEQISWDDTQAFCKKLSESTKQTVRLPTETEWEYACRAGTATTYHSGDAEADLDRVAWYYANSKSTTHPVDQKEANAFGLYDMHGNVWQWCQDWWDDGYYSKSPAENPQGPAHGARRVLRGGSWGNAPLDCRSARRDRIDPDGRDRIIGFRVVVRAFRTP
jgi:formylglycine-generating enzyme required for sulfatase activity